MLSKLQAAHEIKEFNIKIYSTLEDVLFAKILNANPKIERLESHMLPQHTCLRQLSTEFLKDLLIMVECSVNNVLSADFVEILKTKICDSRSLRELWLEEAANDEILASICEKAELTYLGINEYAAVRMTAAALSNVTKLSNLQDISLHVQVGDAFTDEFVKTLCQNCEQLESVDLFRKYKQA